MRRMGEAGGKISRTKAASRDIDLAQQWKTFSDSDANVKLETGWLCPT
jgi:hypothetical protein